MNLLRLLILLSATFAFSIHLSGKTVPHVVAQPPGFAIPDSDWNPIVLTGAGTAGADGNYFQVETNVIAGLAYAVWTNDSGGDFRIFCNNTNLVPSVMDSNYWTLQDSSGANIYYETFGTTPFAKWYINGGALPSPMSGTHLPTLIEASASASDGVLVLTPGIYDIGQYTWTPTNLTVIGYGATIQAYNLGPVIQPFGSFAMYGVTITNAGLIGGLFGGSILSVSFVTNSLTLYDNNVYAHMDGLLDIFQSDNITMTLIGNTFGGSWDTIILHKLPGLTNVVGSIIGNTFWSQTNEISQANTFIHADLNGVRIVGNTILQGAGFAGGSAISTTDANTTNDLSGNIINMQPGGMNVTRRAGTVNIYGHPYAESTLVGTFNFIGDATNAIQAGGFISTRSNGDRYWTRDGSALTHSALTVLTNATPPVNSSTIRAWLSVTNDQGRMGKIPVYY